MDIIDRLATDQPVFHLNGTERWNAMPGTLREIQKNVSAGMKTLEIGCGASTVVFASLGAEHLGISPKSDEHERIRKYLSKVGIDCAHLTLIEGLSDEVLPRLCSERKFDFALIDGAHGFPYPIVDWHYVTRSLKVGGRLILDDIPIPAVACVFRYMQTDPVWRLDDITDNRAAIFTLLVDPPQKIGQIRHTIAVCITGSPRCQ
jgi:hypothetical protein